MTILQHFSRATQVGPVPEKTTRCFCIFNGLLFVAETLPLASQCIIASWLPAATEMSVRELNNIPPQYFTPSWLKSPLGPAYSMPAYTFHGLTGCSILLKFGCVILQYRW